MSSRVSVLISVGKGGRPLLMTADSVQRQRGISVDVALVASAGHSEIPLLDSVAARRGTVIVGPGASLGILLNRAVRSACADYLALVPAGYVLPASFLERCCAVFGARDDVSVVTASVRVHTPDGVGGGTWIPAGTDVAAALADPSSVPPVFVLRRSAWEQAGGFSEELDALVEYEFWLRLAASGVAIAAIPQPPVFRDVTLETGASGPPERYLHHLREVLGRHQSLLGGQMAAVLMGRELRFGRSRERHRELLARRDDDLEELARLRAEAAHHRAYLEHHGAGGMDWGDFRRTDPVSRDWGYDRGVPVDRRYIDDFLASHSSDVRGAVLEIQEDDFTCRFGGPRAVRHDVLDIDASNPRATILADLRCAPGIEAERFDCIILTQTLHVIDDMPAVLSECYRILKPGGVLLATLPAASRVCLEYGPEGDLWRTTPAGARHLFETALGPSQVSTQVFGNVLTNTAFLHGLGADELTDTEYAATDPYFPALTGVRARKSSAPERSVPRGVVLLYHRVGGAPGVHDLAVPPDVFEDHLRWLTSHCSVMPLDELLGAPPERLPDRPVAMTFDDGYVDNLTSAAPLLGRYGAAATFFLTSRWLDEPGEYWWDTLERVLLEPRALPSVFPRGLAEDPQPLSTSSAESRQAAHRRLHEMLVHAPLDRREEVLRILLEWSGASREADPAKRPMRASEVRELARMPGVSIGAHTVNHLALPVQPAHIQQVEASDCRAALASLTGRRVDLFAYPYGAVDRHSAAEIRQSFRWGLSCESRALGAAFDAAAVPRLEVKRWDVAAFSGTIERLFSVSAQDSGVRITRLPD